MMAKMKQLRQAKSAEQASTCGLEDTSSSVEEASQEPQMHYPPELYEDIKVKNSRGQWVDAMIVKVGDQYHRKYEGQYQVQYMDKQRKRRGEKTHWERATSIRCKPGRPKPKTVHDFSRQECGSWDDWVHYIGSGHMLVRDSEGRYLISHRGNLDWGKKNDDWMYPGGLRDNVDDPHIGTAKREFFEEIGVDFPDRLCVRPPEQIGVRTTLAGGKHVVFFAQLTVPMSEIPGLKSDTNRKLRHGAEKGGPIDQNFPYRKDAECDRWAAVTTQEVVAMKAMSAELRRYCEEYFRIADEKKPYLSFLVQDTLCHLYRMSAKMEHELR